MARKVEALSSLLRGRELAAQEHRSMALTHLHFLNRLVQRILSWPLSPGSFIYRLYPASKLYTMACTDS